jgi:hypothetical protein
VFGRNILLVARNVQARYEVSSYDRGGAILVLFCLMYERKYIKSVVVEVSFFLFNLAYAILPSRWI